jgi:hypothetical protein
LAGWGISFWKGLSSFIRLRLNTLELAAGMNGKLNRTEAPQSEGGLGYGAIPL